MAIAFRQTAYDLELRGLNRPQAVYGATEIANRELLWARTGVIQADLVTAQADIGTAQTDIATLEGSIADWGDDGQLSPPEKLPTWLLFKAYVSDQLSGDGGSNGLIYQADLQGVSRTTYNTAINNLRTHMNGLGAPYNASDSTISAWCGTTTAVNGTTHRTLFNNCANARQALVAAVTQNARARGDNAGTSAGYRNRVFYANSPPTAGSSPDGYPLVEGDLWFNQDTTTACPDSNCWGHLFNTSVSPPVPRTGSGIPHNAVARPHRYTGTAWVDAGDRTYAAPAQFPNGIVTENILANQSVSARTLASNLAISTVFRTGNYDGGVGSDGTLPNNGALIDGSPGALYSARFASNGITIGNTRLDQAWFAQNGFASFRLIHGSGGSISFYNRGFTNFSVADGSSSGFITVNIGDFVYSGATIHAVACLSWGGSSTASQINGIVPIMGTECLQSQIVFRFYSPVTNATYTAGGAVAVNTLAFQINCIFHSPRPL
jgi:hypothetical protein